MKEHLSFHLILVLSDCKYFDDVFITLPVLFLHVLCVHYTCLLHCPLKLSAILYSTSLWSLCEDLSHFFCPFLSPNLSHISIFVHLRCINVQCASCMNNCSQSTSDMAHCVILTLSILIFNHFCKHECVMHIALMKYNTYHLYTPKWHVYRH